MIVRAEHHVNPCARVVAGVIRIRRGRVADRRGDCHIPFELFFGQTIFFWLVLLSLFVLVEKVIPAGDLLGRLAGAGMIGWGLYVISLGI